MNLTCNVNRTINCYRFKNIIRSVPYFGSFMKLSMSSRFLLKEIIHEKTGNSTIIEGRYIESPRASLVVKTGLEECHVCPLCALNLNLKHTDVLILSQFLRSDGCLLPKRITGLCSRQQFRITLLVAMAQKAGLMPNLAPSWSKKDPKKRFGSKKFNRYFDDKIIPS